MSKKKAKKPEKMPRLREDSDLTSLEHRPGGEELDLQDDKARIEDTEEHPGEKEDLIALRKENEALKEKVLRKMADLENYKKRAEKEKSEAYFSAKMHWAKEMLPIIDNFERALSSTVEDQDSSFRKGVELIYRQILELLKNMGAEEIEALGEKFNPRFHEAIEILQTDQCEKDMILEVKRKGYLLDKRLLRPSTVSVALPSDDSKKG